MTDYSVIKEVCDIPQEDLFPFAGLLEKEDLAYLGHLMERQFAKEGECLWREGDPDDRLGLVIRGRVKLVKEAETPKHPLVLGLFGPGALVVDFAFVEGLSRETTAYAVEDLEIVYLSRPQFETILTERPALGHRIFSETLISVAEQLRHAYRRLAVFL